MEYISAEEFLKQPVEIQKIFLDWWQCDLGDLYFIGFGENIVKAINEDVEGDIEGDWEWFKSQYQPLLTEGQIRKFIEDKTGCKVEAPWHGCYDIYLVDQLTGQEVIKDYFNLGTDLLKAYWKVAIEIAKED